MRHNMPNGSSLATKQSATGKLTWMPEMISDEWNVYLI